MIRDPKDYKLWLQDPGSARNDQNEITEGIYLKELDINTRNWFGLAQDIDYWTTLVNATLNLRVS